MLLAFQLNSLLGNGAEVAPILLGTIPDLKFTWESGDYVLAASNYFAGATSYSISPAIETGWSFDTVTGVLTVDTDDIDSFGPYTIIATNSNGSTASNEFTIRVIWGTFEDYSGTNTNAVHVPNNYEVCDRSGFRVQAGDLVREWNGAMVRRQDWEARHPQDFVRGRSEKPKPSPRPEQADRFIADDDQVSASDL